MADVAPFPGLPVMLCLCRPVRSDFFSTYYLLERADLSRRGLLLPVPLDRIRSRPEVCRLVLSGFSFSFSSVVSVDYLKNYNLSRRAPSRSARSYPQTASRVLSCPIGHSIRVGFKACWLAFRCDDQSVPAPQNMSSAVCCTLTWLKTSQAIAPTALAI